ncbi:styrene monooxygenase/indole monooxygenase family protein [Nocardiopsis composta]|uniref:Styrene monooxygenase StyA putative substrate binding domain-containing protein n=1 Tax=Nocardiopsis composta TaxID=157465 RepID=A0A7W8QGE6_9ACTN|nr:styrene monooxygenase/indole monooxygenase family protein [Nocardiopsis composta]MBB5430027.1 hypothetical protein [Nocardiopsis composta]
MRRVLVVGSGQSGLQLALGLQAHGYEVTVMSARTPEEIRHGRPMSTQLMFAPALRIEREMGLDFWSDRTPWCVGSRLSMAPAPARLAARFHLTWDEGDYAQSVDQRVKMPAWLELFESRGGEVVYHTAMTSELESLTRLYDLTVIAAGKGELVELFDRNDEHSPYDRPQRMLSVIYLEGVRRPADDPDPRLHVSFFPGTGEVVSMPGLTTTGRPCEIVMWEAVPGGPFDCWQDRPAPEAFLERTLKMLREYAPWEHELFTDAVPTDRRCTLFGGYAPIVRHPVGRLSADSHVLGMADVVVANDPISAQGANNAARCADVYLKAILEHGDRPFDPAWMQRTFDVFWQHAEHSARFSNLMLNPPEHVQKALGAAQTNPAVARRLVYGYNEPADFQHWLYTPEQVDAYLASVADQASAPAD